MILRLQRKYFMVAEARLHFSRKHILSSPSSLSHINIKQKPHALTIPEIKKVIDGYVAATVRVKKGGFDAVEIHGGMGYLINQFLSEGQRTREKTDMEAVSKTG